MKKKYIIELEDGVSLWGFFTDTDGKIAVVGVIKQPYAEPDLDAIRNEAYDKAFEDAEQVAESGKRAMYQKGLSDAWEAARKICTNWVLPDSVLSKIFGMDKTIDDIMKESTASEAIEKIRQYEQEKEEQIQVGDEVISPNGKGVVTEIKDIYVRIMYAKGSGQVVKPEDLTKTGRHFPEIAEVLQKMKETDNG